MILTKLSNGLFLAIAVAFGALYPVLMLSPFLGLNPVFLLVGLLFGLASYIWIRKVDLRTVSRNTKFDTSILNYLYIGMASVVFPILFLLYYSAESWVRFVVLFMGISYALFYSRALKLVQRGADV